MDLLSFIVAVLPVFIIGLYIYKKDRVKESSKLLFKLFFDRCEKNLLPYLKYRNIKKDIRQWITEMFMGDTGFFWGVQVFQPVVGNIYKVSTEKIRANADGLFYSFNIFDC